ncbi:Uncharacterized protein TCM_013255 [Theobroma cacao]|uniref:Uncharacterized protein n=1 Tax=Theobroma cacao TaxID=3641 RepID=A0A061FXC3_THECC|nr:Uncharacterized protein TCM_013255 [Theobroma cacao]
MEKSRQFQEVLEKKKGKWPLEESSQFEIQKKKKKILHTSEIEKSRKKMTKKGHKTEKKKEKGKSVKKGNISFSNFRNKAHEDRYRKLENAPISCGKFIGWDSFNEILEIQTSLSNYFEELKLKEFSTFKNRFYSASLVKEFYASIALDKDELEDSDDCIEDSLNVF